MAFGIHTLNISRIVTLLVCVHGAAGGACADYTASQQTAAGSDSGTAPSTECGACCRAQRRADYGARDPAIHRRLISGSAANLGKCELLTNSIIVTKPFERQTGTG